jgi:hypothetical protein
VYGFTHHRVTLGVYAASVPERVPPNCAWFSQESVLADAALVAAHRRALESLLKGQTSG